VQAGYDAFTCGDLAAVEKLFRPDAVWHAQRLGALSGDHTGWPEIRRFFGETMEITKSTFRVTVTERCSNPEGVAFMARSQAEPWTSSGRSLPRDATRTGPAGSPARRAARGLVARHRPGQEPPARGGDARLPAGHTAARLEGLREPEAAADVYQALVSARPHRPAHTPASAASALKAAPGPDGQAVAAVLEAAGHRAARRATFPAGLTGREVEVLRLLVGGRSERQIAEELVIAASTVHTHVVHTYDKTGVSTRAGAAVLAMEHGLIHPAPVT
jgi:DNA-binding CsgD family transcriptional regulator